MILTEKQQAVWGFIKAFEKLHGETPTFEEIRKGANCGSSTIQKTLKVLKKGGLAKQPKKRKKRGIKING